MAAVSETAGSRQWICAGNKVWVQANLSSVDNNDTWVTGLALVEHATFTPETADNNESFGMTRSGGTITFIVESGTLAGSIIAVGV